MIRLESDTAKWLSFVLFLAAAYNVAWGTLALAAPGYMLRLLGLPTDHSVFWQCIGMFVVLYGIGYWFASSNPTRYWPFVFVGLLGKTLGPIGAVAAITEGTLPFRFLWINVTNDLIWLPPFIWVLAVVRQADRQATRRSHRRQSLYRSALNEEFDKMAPDIRRFHDSVEPIEVRGTFESKGATNAIGGLLLRLSGFPRSCPSLEVSLRVIPKADGERWHRDFGGQIVVSSQRLIHGQLTERYGPLLIYLEPRVESGALVVRDSRSTFLGIPLPPFLTPRVEAHGIDVDDGIEVSVEVSCTPFGRLVRYAGVVRIVEEGAAQQGVSGLPRSS